MEDRAVVVVVGKMVDAPIVVLVVWMVEGPSLTVVLIVGRGNVSEGVVSIVEDPIVVAVVDEESLGVLVVGKAVE